MSLSPTAIQKLMARLNKEQQELVDCIDEFRGFIQACLLRSQFRKLAMLLERVRSQAISLFATEFILWQQVGSDMSAYASRYASALDHSKQDHVFLIKRFDLLLGGLCKGDSTLGTPQETRDELNLLLYELERHEKEEESLFRDLCSIATRNTSGAELFAVRP